MFDPRRWIRYDRLVCFEHGQVEMKTQTEPRQLSVERMRGPYLDTLE